MAGVWASAANVGYSTYGPFAGGNKFNAIAAGGYSGLSNAVEFTGAAWRSISSLPAAIFGCSSGDCGNSTLALIAGGKAGSTLRTDTHMFNSQTWATGNNLNVARRAHAGMARNFTSAMVVGGWVTGTDDVLDSCETFNGLTWTTIATYYAAIQGLAGGGNGANAIAFGGYIGSSTYVANANLFNGVAWVARESMSVARYELGGGGSSMQALAFGGRDTVVKNTTEEYNSLTWAAGGNLGTARRLVSGGLSGSGISVSGYTTAGVQTCETYTYPDFVRSPVSRDQSSRDSATSRLSRFDLKVQGTPVELTTPTYEGSGQVVHVSVRYIPETFGGYKYWLFSAPYPYSNDDYENPSVWGSNDTITWAVPDGITNPMAPKPTHTNCDTELVYDGTNLLCYYMKFEIVPTGTLQRITISDDPLAVGSNVACTFDDSITELVGPMVSYNGPGEWYLWMNDRVTYGLVRFQSTDGLHWTNKTQVGIYANGTRVQDTLLIWHTSVLRFGSRYLFLMCAYPVGTNNAYTDLYWGVAETWDSHIEFNMNPLLTEFDGWGNREIYRSCVCQLENGAWRLFISAATTAHVWHAGYVDVSMW